MSTQHKYWYQNGALIAVLLGIVITLFVFYPYYKGFLPSERRDKAVELYNSYKDFLKSYAVKDGKMTSHEINVLLSTLNPYEPRGVEPKLSEAVAVFKAVVQNNYEYYQINGAYDPDFRNKVTKAFLEIEKCFNEIASAEGGVATAK